MEYFDRSHPLAYRCWFHRHNRDSAAMNNRVKQCANLTNWFFVKDRAIRKRFAESRIRRILLYNNWIFFLDLDHALKPYGDIFTSGLRWDNLWPLYQKLYRMRPNCLYLTRIRKRRRLYKQTHESSCCPWKALKELYAFWKRF